MKTIMRTLLLVVAAAWLTACSEEASEPVNTDPVAFHAGDECHVCGMLVTEWPGAKGQSVNKQNGQTHKFCSTVDMFAWWLQPENRSLQAEIYVHDMAKTSWEQPGDEHLMNAREAWYVVGSNLQGAMGPSIASFSAQAAAQELTEQRGGRVIRFEDINLDILQEISQLSHAHAAQHSEQIQQMYHGHAESEHGEQDKLSGEAEEASADAEQPESVDEY